MNNSETIDSSKIKRIAITVMRVAILFSIGVALTGLLIYVFDANKKHIDYSHFKPTFALDITQFKNDLTTFKSTALMQLGLLILIITPLIRIAFILWEFVVKKDYLYILIGSLVLVILAISAFWGAR